MGAPFPVNALQGIREQLPRRATVARSSPMVCPSLYQRQLRLSDALIIAKNSLPGKWGGGKRNI